MKGIKISCTFLVFFLLGVAFLSRGCVVSLSRGSPPSGKVQRTTSQLEAGKSIAKTSMLEQKGETRSPASGQETRTLEDSSEDHLVIPSVHLSLPIAQTTADMTHFACKYQPETLGKGNYVLISHNYWNTFGKLSSLNRGDPIRVTEDGKEVIFHVVKTQVIDCHETQVLGPTKESQVTLITCFGQAGTAKRLVITGREEVNP